MNHGLGSVESDVAGTSVVVAVSNPKEDLVKLLEAEPPDAASRAYLLLGPQIISLILTGYVVWIAAAAPPLFRSSLSTVIGRAVGCALLAWICNATMLAGIYFSLAEGISDHLRRIVRASTTAVWIAPATILVTEQSAPAILAALILVVSTTRGLYSDWRWLQAEPDQFPPAHDADGLFQHYAAPASAFSGQLAAGLALAFFAQTGVVAAMMHYPLLAAGCFAFSTVFATVFGMTARMLPPKRPGGLPRSILGVILTVLLAVALTLGGSLGGLTRGFGGTAAGNSRRPPGVVEMVRNLLRQWLYRGKTDTVSKLSGTTRDLASSMPGFEPAAARGTVGRDEFPGVILWPEVKAVATLVAPVPAGVGFSAHSTRPLGIPFSGEYWIFRAPSRRPPYGSFFQRGSPAWLGFVSTDRVPLQMEAHHKLDKPIDLRCCNKIQMAIWNGDRYPGTVLLEVILINTEEPRRPPQSQSLGTAAVKSSPGALPVRETLEFPLPRTRMLERFNEFKVVFHRDRKRLDKSARIEIDRFVLVPASLGL